MKKVEKCVVCGEKACGEKKQGKALCKWCLVASTYFAEPPKQAWVRIPKIANY